MASPAPTPVSDRPATETSGGLRKRRQGGFVTVPSPTIRDKELSFRARGVLAWLLDHPDGWEVKSDGIAREGKEGRDAIRSALTELAAAGYYRIERRRVAGGHYVTVTAVSDVAMPVWAEGYRALQEAAGQRRDGSDARPRPPVYVRDETGEWVRSDRPETVDTEDGLPGFGKPGVGFPGAGKPGPVVQTVTQTEEPPNPPASRGAKCPHGRSTNCRRCGTSPRAAEERQRLTDAETAAAELAELERARSQLPWCGTRSCDEHSRWRETDDGQARRCPLCHPDVAIGRPSPELVARAAHAPSLRLGTRAPERVRLAGPSRARAPSF